MLPVYKIGNKTFYKIILILFIYLFLVMREFFSIKVFVWILVLGWFHEMLWLFNKICPKTVFNSPFYVFFKFQLIAQKLLLKVVLPLRNVEHVAVLGPDELAGVDGPEPAHDSEKRGLAAAVRPRDEQMRSRWHSEREARYHHVHVRCDNRHVQQLYAAVPAVEHLTCEHTVVVIKYLVQCFDWSYKFITIRNSNWYLGKLLKFYIA